ncbi:hypothetical protein PFISCL1PPCAC_17828, partial [Pristionchus fissidentatus]
LRHPLHSPSPPPMLCGYLLFSALLVSVSAWNAAFADVRGSFLCDSDNGRARALLPDVKAELWEHDVFPIRDDEISTTKSDKSGSFAVTGSKAEFCCEEFYLYIRVPCDVVINRCDKNDAIQ